MKSRNEGRQGDKIPRAPNHYGGTEQCDGRGMTAGPPKSPNNVISTFFNTVHLLSKDLRFEHGDAKIVSHSAPSSLVTPLHMSASQMLNAPIPTTPCRVW